MTFLTILYLLSLDGTEYAEVARFPSAQACAQALSAAVLAEGWSAHCLRTPVLASSPRPKFRPNQ